VLLLLQVEHYQLDTDILGLGIRQVVALLHLAAEVALHMADVPEMQHNAAELGPARQLVLSLVEGTQVVLRQVAKRVELHWHRVEEGKHHRRMHIHVQEAADMHSGLAWAHMAAAHMKSEPHKVGNHRHQRAVGLVDEQQQPSVLPKDDHKCALPVSTFREDPYMYLYKRHYHSTTDTLETNDAFPRILQ